MLDIPQNFLNFNAQDTKNVTIVVKIEGFSQELSNRKIQNRVKYGMPGLTYGIPGLVYGGLLPDETSLPILDMSGSSLTIDQSIEPEEGRSSISQLALSFIDKDGIMTRLCTPGLIIPDIQGAAVDVYVGFDEIAWPEDYVNIFRGYISGVSDTAGRVVLTLSDPNLKNRQELMSMGTAKVSRLHEDWEDGLSVDTTRGFKAYVTYGIFGSGIDPAVTLYLKVGDEWIKRTQSVPTMGEDFFLPIERGARGTVAAEIEEGAEVEEAVEIEDNVIDMALKLMLSGNGIFAEGTKLISINYTGDPLTPIEKNTIILNGVDAVGDLGLTIGDWVVITGGLNDEYAVQITGFKEYNGYPNRILYVTQNAFDMDLEDEPTTTATVGFRSKYDIYPVGIGMRLTPVDVDVERFEEIRDTFLYQAENKMRIFIKSDVTSGKDFIEKNLYKPIGAYSLTRFGKISIGLTKPPIATGRLVTLSGENVKNPKSIKVERSISGRKFFNRVDYSFDYNDEGEATSQLKVIDTGSTSRIGVMNVLRIEAIGGRTDLQVEEVFKKRAEFILSRYKNGATSFTLQILFKEGILIQAGDVVAVLDDGSLQLPNHSTGFRDMGFQLFEVIRKTIDLKTGAASVTLVSGITGTASDRYGVIAPSSLVGVGSTSNRLILKRSFGTSPLANERDKWVPHIGRRILIHSEDFSQSQECAIESIDPTNKDGLIVAGLSFAPTENMIVDVINYPASTNRNAAREYKALYSFYSKQLVLAEDSSDSTHIEFDPSDISNIVIGTKLRVHNYSYSNDSGEVEIKGIVGNIVEVDDMGFTPVQGDFVDNICFPDKGTAYKLI